MTGHEECVEALLQHSASFMVRDCRGRSPVHLAAACGHVGVLGGLLHAAQSLDSIPIITDNQGYTPLHWACYNGDYRNTHSFPFFFFFFSPHSLMIRLYSTVIFYQCKWLMSVLSAYLFLILSRSWHVCWSAAGTRAVPQGRGQLLQPTSLCRVSLTVLGVDWGGGMKN